MLVFQSNTNVRIQVSSQRENKSSQDLIIVGITDWLNQGVLEIH